MLEEGEISDSSNETSSVDSTGATINSKNSSDQFLIQNSEKSLIDIFAMDVNEDSILKPKKKQFTMWTEQLINEQKKLKVKDQKLNNSSDSQTYKQSDKQSNEQSNEQSTKQSKKQFNRSSNKLVNQTKERKLNDERTKLTKFSSYIAQCLQEKRKDIVYKIVQACGIDKSNELCEEAIKIYQTTGMLRPDNSLRTAGGCFFQLVKLKGNLDETTKKEIFYEPTSQYSQKKKQLKNARKKVKKQLKTQQQLEQIFSSMNLNINVTIR